MENFPGFDLATAWASAWSRLLETQASMFNDAWAKARQGTWTSADAFAAATSLYQAYWDTSTGFARKAFNPGSPLVAFVFDRTQRNAPQQLVRLAEAQDATSEIACTPFRRLGEAGSLPDGALVCRWANDKKRDAVLVSLDNRELDKVKPGEYVAFVTDQRSSNGVPLAVVLLRVT